MRRLFQIRLRTALAGMFLIALACGWVSAHLRQWQAEQRVLAAIGPAAVRESPEAFNKFAIFC